MSDQLSEWRRKAQELLGEDNSIDWTSESRGYIVCPLRYLHTTRNGPRDTFLYLEGFPHIHCLHESCHDELREINRFLRIQLTGRSVVNVDFARSKNYEMVDCLRKNRDAIIEKYIPKVRELPPMQGSPSFFIRRMFEPEHWVWVGEPQMTGERFKLNFWPAANWANTASWKFICPNPLVDGCWDRTNNNVVEFRHLVLESDKLNILETRAMFEAVEDIFLLKLKAIVFSGNKSLHGWFAHPGMEWLALNKSLLEAMGFCPGTFSPSQPVRLPGVIRENGKMQSLLWITPN